MVVLQKVKIKKEEPMKMPVNVLSFIDKVSNF